jgi:hypothetical protein
MVRAGQKALRGHEGPACSKADSEPPGAPQIGRRVCAPAHCVSSLASADWRHPVRSSAPGRVALYVEGAARLRVVVPPGSLTAPGAALGTSTGDDGRSRLAVCPACCIPGFADSPEELVHRALDAEDALAKVTVGVRIRLSPINRLCDRCPGLVGGHTCSHSRHLSRMHRGGDPLR